MMRRVHDWKKGGSKMILEPCARAPEGAGTIAGFEQEALPHLSALYNTAVHLTGNPTEAEDLVQDTMLRAFKFFHLYRAGTNCKAWLFTILRNTYINQSRKNSRMRAERDIDVLDYARHTVESTFCLSELNTPAAELFNKLYDDEVSAALDSIPKNYREPLLLRDVEGFTYQEVAEILGVPIGTVRSRLSRAREEMRRALRNYAVQTGIVSRGEVDSVSGRSAADCRP